MVEKLQIDNPANKPMHYEKPFVVGVLNPPDRLPKVIVYSPQEADRMYRTMEYDLYENSKKAKAPERYKFPKILKILGGILVVAGGIIFRKDIGKFIKNLFKKSPKI